MIFHQVRDMKSSKLKRLMGNDYFSDLELVHRADAMGSTRDLSGLEFVEEVRSATPEIRPDPLLTGQDLIDLGFSPSPTFGKVLREAYDAQLEGTLTAKEQALQFARSHPELAS